MERIQPISAIRPAVIDLRDGGSDRLRLASYRRQPRQAREPSTPRNDRCAAWVEFDPWAPPGPREIEAARALGVSTEASQAEIDARFRQIVRNQRPDLGQMSPEDLAVVLSARRVLSERSRHSTAFTSQTLTSQAPMTATRYGKNTTRAGHFIDLDA